MPLQKPMDRLTACEKRRFGMNDRDCNWTYRSAHASAATAREACFRLWHIRRYLVALVTKLGNLPSRPRKLPPNIEAPHQRTSSALDQQAYQAVNRGGAKPTEVIPPPGRWSLLPERVPAANGTSLPPFVDAERWYAGEIRAGRPARLHPYGPGAYAIMVKGREIIFPSRYAYQAWQVAQDIEKRGRPWPYRLWNLVRERISA